VNCGEERDVDIAAALALSMGLDLERTAGPSVGPLSCDGRDGGDGEVARRYPGDCQSRGRDVEEKEMDER